MNSFMQQLFMIPQIRRTITGLRGYNSPLIQVCRYCARLNQSLLFQELQNMFLHLEHTVQRYYDTRPFCEAYTDPTGQPMQFHVQVLCRGLNVPETYCARRWMWRSS